MNPYVLAILVMLGASAIELGLIVYRAIRPVDEPDMPALEPDVHAAADDSGVPAL